MKQIQTIQLLLLSLLILTFSACTDDEPKPNNPPSNEGELITTLKVIFTDSTDNSIKSFTFKDTDGDGGNNPTQFDSIILNTSRTYSVSILLLDESKTETDTISNEVLEEADEHLFVFTPSSINLNIVITDMDSKGLPIGLKSKWKTGAVSNGTITIALKHQPGVKDGSSTPGETDIEIAFPIRIE